MNFRYLQLAILVLAGGGIYPLVYLRTNFELSMQAAFNLSPLEFGQCYSILGVFLVLGYIPSGWLADRIAPRILLSFSLLTTGLLGLWFWTIPSFSELLLIFAGWGFTTGFTFWGPLIKETNLVAHHDEQGRFFGILEGGRGAVEALIYTIATAVFAWSMSRDGGNDVAAMRDSVWVFVIILFALVPATYFTLQPQQHETGEDDQETAHTDTLGDLKIILSNSRVWLMAGCIFAGYQVYYATYSFSAYMQAELALGAVVVGWIGVARLWMRAISPVLAGFIGDCWSVGKALSISLIVSSLSLLSTLLLTPESPIPAIVAIIMGIGIMTFAIRGLYWGTLDQCAIAPEKRGLAIGVISFIGYSPEIVAPVLSGYLIETFPGTDGYAYYFSYCSVIGLLGAIAAWRLDSLKIR